MGEEGDDASGGTTGAIYRASYAVCRVEACNGDTLGGQDRSGFPDMRPEIKRTCEGCALLEVTDGCAAVWRIMRTSSPRVRDVDSDLYTPLLSNDATACQFCWHPPGTILVVDEKEGDEG